MLVGSLAAIINCTFPLGHCISSGYVRLCLAILSGVSSFYCCKRDVVTAYIVMVCLTLSCYLNSCFFFILLQLQLSNFLSVWWKWPHLILSATWY